MPTARQFRQLADAARRDAAAWRAKADLADEQARELDRLAAMVERSGLPDSGEDRSIVGSKMRLDTTPTARNVRIAAGRTKRRSGAKRALLEAGATPADIADELGVGRSTVNAWCLGTRPIPVRYRDALAKPHGKRHAVAAAVWPRVGE